MKLIVMKFGGTSVGSIDKINNVANIVEKQLIDKKLIVVLSAMSGVTNKMQEYIDEIESNEIIENDLILTSGEAVSVGLLSAILKKRNIKSIPLLGWQIPIITDSNHQKAKILNIDKYRIKQYLKDYDVITTNERGTSQEFVTHGANLQGQVNILRQQRKEYPSATKDILKKKINHNTLYVSWIKEPDYSKDIRECWEEYKDHGWACGASAGFIACKIEKPKEVYLIGHDLVSDTDKINNIYSGTKHYMAKDNSPTPHVNWVDQWNSLMTWNQNIKFYKVNKARDNMPTNQKLKEWEQWEKKGILTYITQAELLDKLSQK